MYLYKWLCVIALCTGESTAGMLRQLDAVMYRLTFSRSPYCSADGIVEKRGNLSRILTLLHWCHHAEAIWLEAR